MKSARPRAVRAGRGGIGERTWAVAWGWVASGRRASRLKAVPQGQRLPTTAIAALVGGLSGPMLSAQVAATHRIER
ncbi:DUF6053 domain-containing protein [Lysobacter enzymogenes]|uniref:DUF6053 domain-containing protein n=1 Tax=Lysobacter enzymogenes TaxID=69 RepID=UPI00374949DD